MTAFDDAAAALHADANLSRRAFYIAGGTGAPVSIGIIYSEPLNEAGFGDSGKSGREIAADLLRAEAPSPARGDILQIAPPGREPAVTDPVFLIATVEADEQSIVWRCKIRPRG